MLIKDISHGPEQLQILVGQICKVYFILSILYLCILKNKINDPANSSSAEIAATWLNYFQ